MWKSLFSTFLLARHSSQALFPSSVSCSHSGCACENDTTFLKSPGLHRRANDIMCFNKLTSSPVLHFRTLKAHQIFMGWKIFNCGEKLNKSFIHLSTYRFISSLKLFICMAFHKVLGGSFWKVITSHYKVQLVGHIQGINKIFKISAGVV